MTLDDYGRYFQIDVDRWDRNRDVGFAAFLAARFPLKSANGRYWLECSSYEIGQPDDDFCPLTLSFRLALLNNGTIVNASEQDVGWASIPSMDLARRLTANTLAMDAKRVIDRYEEQLPDIQARLDAATGMPEPAFLIHGDE